MLTMNFSPFASLYQNISATMLALGLTHADEVAFKTWAYSAWIDSGFTQHYAVFSQPASSTKIQFDVRVAASGHKINVWWGDGTSNSYSPGTSSDTACAKTYGAGALRPVVVIGSVKEFRSGYTDGRTNFGGNLTKFRSLTYLIWAGNNTGTGNITGMPLTYLIWAGNNTGTGNITGMPLTYLNWGGNNTGTGNITGMPLTFLIWTGNNTGTGNITGMPLTYLIWGGNNTGTGDITGMPLTYLNWGGNNTGTGWENVAASATGLCYLYQRGLTVLSSAQVNAVLAGFWANRDATKPRVERTINLANIGNGAPTGQGLVDKAALQAYRSPTPPGTAALWTVTTN